MKKTKSPKNIENWILNKVREYQETPDLITIRELAKKSKLSQKKILQICEDMDLCINVAIGVFGCGSGIYEHDNIGDYSIEDLTA